MYISKLAVAKATTLGLIVGSCLGFMIISANRSLPTIETSSLEASAVATR